jgi:hypothetical protein
VFIQTVWELLYPILYLWTGQTPAAEQIQLNAANLEVDIHNLIAGLYSIVILTEEGQILEQKLIVR